MNEVIQPVQLCMTQLETTVEYRVDLWVQFGRASNNVSIRLRWQWSFYVITRSAGTMRLSWGCHAHLDDDLPLWQKCKIQKQCPIRYLEFWSPEVKFLFNSKKCTNIHEHCVCYTSLDHCWFIYKFARATDHSAMLPTLPPSFPAQLVTDQFTTPSSKEYNLHS
jgi:hypothetical protein